MRDEIPHGKGVLTVGPGELGGGGLTRLKTGDRYYGEFMTGFAMGMGQFISADGKSVYTGEYLFGRKDGCGILEDWTPFLRKIKKGVPPAKAWKDARPDIEQNAVWGTWAKDAFIGGPAEMGNGSAGALCHRAEIEGVVEEVHEVVARCKMFEHKPGSMAAPWLLRDGDGVPGQLQQVKKNKNACGSGVGGGGKGGAVDHGILDDDNTHALIPYIILFLLHV